MIFTSCAPQISRIRSLTLVPDLPYQHRLPVLRRPHEVQVDFVDAVRAVSVIAHAAQVTRRRCELKPSPKGEGLTPPRWETVNRGFLCECAKLGQ